MTRDKNSTKLLPFWGQVGPGPWHGLGSPVPHYWPLKYQREVLSAGISTTSPFAILQAIFFRAHPTVVTHRGVPVMVRAPTNQGAAPHTCSHPTGQMLLHLSFLSTPIHFHTPRSLAKSKTRTEHSMPRSFRGTLLTPACPSPSK